MRLQLSELFRVIADQTDMGRMLFRDDESQTHVGEFQQRPRVILVCDLAFERLAIPVYGRRDLSHRHGNVID